MKRKAKEEVRARVSQQDGSTTEHEKQGEERKGGMREMKERRDKGGEVRDGIQKKRKCRGGHREWRE